MVEVKIEEAVAADVITAALFTRFRSRQDHTFGEKMLSAIRFGFVGQVQGQEPIDPERELKDAPRSAATQTTASAADGAAMLDKGPIRTSPGAQLIACPPKQQARLADPCALVIFGATGDLTKRLVVPGIRPFAQQSVPERFALIGVARTEATAGSCVNDSMIC